MQCNVSKQFDLKKVHFYSNPKLLNCRLYYCLGHFKNIVRFIKKSKAMKYSPESRLQSADEILVQIEEESRFHNKKKKNVWNYDHILKKSNIDIIYNFGLELRNSKNNDDAKEIFEELIELTTLSNNQNETITSKATSTINKLEKNKFQLQIWKQIALCCIDLNKPLDALDYLQRSLKIDEKISLDIGLDVNVAKTLNNIGRCFKNMHKPADALDYLQRSLKIQEKTSLDIGSDVNVARTLNNIGMCFRNIHKPADALNYLQRSLKIY